MPAVIYCAADGSSPALHPWPPSACYGDSFKALPIGPESTHCGRRGMATLLGGRLSRQSSKRPADSARKWGRATDKRQGLRPSGLSWPSPLKRSADTIGDETRTRWGGRTFTRPVLLDREHRSALPTRQPGLRHAPGHSPARSSLTENTGMPCRHDNQGSDMLQEIHPPGLLGRGHRNALPTRQPGLRHAPGHSPARSSLTENTEAPCRHSGDENPDTDTLQDIHPSGPP